MLAVLLCSLLAAADDKPAIECVQPDRGTGTSAAVILDDSPLVHTGQLFLPQNPRTADAGKQLTGLLDRLAHDLKAFNSSLDRVVKLNVHIARPGDLSAVHKTLAARFDGKHKPAVCVSVGTPAMRGVLVSLDAVAASQSTPTQVELTTARDAAYSVMPAGPVYYVAGQAEDGKTLAEATRKTLESLKTTLAHYKRDLGHVAQIKAFVSDMTRVADVRAEIEKVFGEGKVPPVVLIEWTMKTPIEIELIATADPEAKKEKDAIDYLTPPKMTPSPVYSRVARINHGRRIYTSGIYGCGKDGETQVNDVFEQLNAILKATKSDLKHLAKATYLVETDDSSQQLNAQRPKYYDPKRPPSASKAAIAATGKKGCGLIVDMIAVQKP
ncbi:MAG: RidA family protein [Gemmataceae bacterium]